MTEICKKIFALCSLEEPWLFHLRTFNAGEGDWIVTGKTGVAEAAVAIYGFS